MCQPGSRIMFAVTPCSDRMPVSIRPADSATWWLCATRAAPSSPGRWCRMPATCRRRAGRARPAARRAAARASAPPSPAGRRRAAASGALLEIGVEPARARPAAAARRCSTSRAAPPGRRGVVRKSSAYALAREHQAQHVLGALGVAARPEHVLERARRPARGTERALGIGSTSTMPWSGSPGAPLSTQTSLRARRGLAGRRRRWPGRRPAAGRPRRSAA